MNYFTSQPFYFFCLIVLFASCEKKEFIADIGTPVFTAEVPFLNENKLEVVAGDDLYYMFASHQEVENGIIYSGLFGKEVIATRPSGSFLSGICHNIRV